MSVCNRPLYPAAGNFTIYSRCSSDERIAPSRAIYNWDYQSRDATRPDSTLSAIGSDSEVQNWTAEIIATSADALAVNPRLWPAICHSELGAIRYGGFLPMCDAAWSGGAESFASTPVSVFSMPELPAAGKISRAYASSTNNYTLAVAATAAAAVRRVAPRRELFISPENFRRIKTTRQGRHNATRESFKRRRKKVRNKHISRVRFFSVPREREKERDRDVARFLAR